MRASEAALHDVEKLLRVHPGLGGRQYAFTEDLKLCGQDGVHRHLAGEALAVPAQVNELLAHDFQHRRGFIQRLLLAAQHEEQLALFRAVLAARHRSIEQAGALFFHQTGQLHAHHRADGARIDPHRAAPERLQAAALAADHLFHGRRIAHD